MKLNGQLLELNISVFLISTSGIFGRMVHLSPELTIFYRCILAALMLYVFLRYKKARVLTRPLPELKYLLLVGVLMAGHWVGYFYALSLSSIAIAMITLHTHPVITAFLEPLILKTKFQSYHLALAGIVLLGIWFLLPSFDVKDKIVISTLFGILSALSFSLRNIWTRQLTSHYTGSEIMFYNLIVMIVVLFPFLFFHNSEPLTLDWPYIVALALFTTAIGHTLLVNALKHFSASSVALMSSIIPVYGILWGVILLNEIPSTKTIIGGILILSSFVIESLVSHRKIKTSTND